MNSNQRKAETLGMNASTANSLLRRNIIWELLVNKTGMIKSHICYKCQEAIMSPEELSIEHIEPWEGRENGKELFWDLNNVAFSHKRCNRPHKNHRIIPPEGMSWCSGCQKFLPLNEFQKHSKRWSGLQSECRSCKSRGKAKWREKYGKH